MPVPPATPEPGWTPVQPFLSLDSHSFLVANPSGESVRSAYFRGPAAGALYAKAWFGRETQGPPGHVHGGAMSAVLDEAMGGASWMNGYRSVAATLSDLGGTAIAESSGLFIVLRDEALKNT